MNYGLYNLSVSPPPRRIGASMSRGRSPVRVALFSVLSLASVACGGEHRTGKGPELGEQPEGSTNWPQMGSNASSDVACRDVESASAGPGGHVGHWPFPYGDGSLTLADLNSIVTGGRSAYVERLASEVRLALQEYIESAAEQVDLAEAINAITYEHSNERFTLLVQLRQEVLRICEGEVDSASANELNRVLSTYGARDVKSTRVRKLEIMRTFGEFGAKRDQRRGGVISKALNRF